MTLPAVPFGEGNPLSKVMLVGEAWGEYESRCGLPFQGPSGQELNRLLQEVGLDRSQCYTTNLVNARPPANNIEAWIARKKKDYTPDMVQLRGVWVKPIVLAGYLSLLQEIELVKPNLIVTLGGTSLWALTGASGILKWRGSQLDFSGDSQLESLGDGHQRSKVLDASDRPWSCKLIPTIHPAALLREPSIRPAVVNDLRRAAAETHSREYLNVPEWNIRVRPSFSAVLTILGELLARLDSGESLWIDFDIETRAGHIACAGISWSAVDALCIPLMCVEDKLGYWSEEMEGKIVHTLYRLLTHPNVKVRGQNIIYDAQYTFRHWHWVPRVAQDTMIAHHSMFCGTPKSLAYQASMYCDHYVYWKDDGKTWQKNMSEEQLWRYNGIDCLRTRECGEVETRTLAILGLEKVDEFQQQFFWPVLETMKRGVRIDKKKRAEFALELQEEIAKREAYFVRVLGHALNPRSPKQMCTLFYEDLQQRKNFSRPTKTSPSHLTCDDEALTKIGQREPLLLPLLRRISEFRSLGVFLSTFVLAPLDSDGRMRTSYNICGTETFRFSSSENAFGSGTNLQNIPAGGDDDESDLELPNVRQLFIPDDGYTIFDTDLSKADLRIVVWEAEELEMKAMLAEGQDPYIEVAREYYKDPSIRKEREPGVPDPRYRMFKSFCHGTHYLGSPQGLAARLGLTVHQADKTQRWYFSRFPRIQSWQADFKGQLLSRRYVQNIFGYRRYYFGRIEDATFREAIAWLPQSTVALYINRIWMALHKNHPEIQILLQVHDSLVGQFPSHRRTECLEKLAICSKIVLPYPDPLVIPVGVKTSERSWGHCH